MVTVFVGAGSERGTKDDPEISDGTNEWLVISMGGRGMFSPGAIIHFFSAICAALETK